MSQRSFFALAAFVALSSMLLPSATGQTVLYSDSFNRVTGSGDPNGLPADPNNFSDWGDNDNALGGTEVNTWAVGPERGGGANQTTDGQVATTVEGSARYPLDVTSIAPNGFVIELDFNRFHPFNEPDPFGENPGFITIGLGTESDDVQGGGFFNVNNADFTLLFQQSVGSNQGNTQFFEDSVLFAPATDGDPGPVDYGDPLIEHSVELTMVPAVAGQYGEADTINGTLIVDKGTANETTPYNFSVLGGADFGVLSLASSGFVHRSYDNLVVTALPVTGTPGDADGDNDVDGTDFLILQRDNPSEIPTWEANYPTPLSAIAAVPEPSALAIVALGSMLLAVTRSRSL